MLDIQVQRTARKEHVCHWDCGDPIKPGDRYISSSLPPHSEMGNTRWLRAALHGPTLYDCPRYKRREGGERA